MATRSCHSCGTDNEADARFCEGCGAVLERACTACGSAARSAARFCRACGAPLGEPADAPSAVPARKTVTVLFADLVGSTGFEERIDAETAREVLGRYHGLLRSTAERYRAGVTKYIGDGFMAMWGVPEVCADDADRAVEAAVELQDHFTGFADRVAQAYGTALALRVAVNTGEVVVGSGDADVVGDALNVGARLESECVHGGVVVGEETWRCTRGRYRFEPMGRIKVKGRAKPVAVYRWLGHPTDINDSAPFVGRADELRRLGAALDAAIAANCARLVTVIGDPGLGKTRLAEEFVAGRSDVGTFHIRCTPEGNVALGPFVEMLRTRDIEAELPLGVTERDRILRGVRGVTTGLAGSVEETFWALRRFIEVLAAATGLIVILDDVQWADSLLLDFVEHLAEWVRDAPVLMLALTRAELRQNRPDLVAVGGFVSDVIRLGGLEPLATAELAIRVVGSGDLPPELLSRLPMSTGGNPLFVRELVGMLVQDGVLVRHDAGWRLTIDVDAISVPPTIRALLASRLERVHTADRRTLETASVIGTDFSPAALSALAGGRLQEVKASLDRLRRLELVQPTGAYSADEPLWRFHHFLIRDVAYRRLLKSDRAALHQRLADWLRSGEAGEVFNSDETVARHLEAAHGYRCDLDLLDADTTDLAARAARSYLASARRALDRDELMSAGTQAARGAALAVEDPGLRAELLTVGCEALLSAQDVAAVAPLVDELEHTADDPLAPWATCYRCQYLLYTDPTRLPEVDDRLRNAIEEFTRREDTSGLAKAHRVRAGARARMGRIGDAENDLFESLIAARRSADHRQITAALAEAPNAALWGPSPAPKAGGRCLDVVRMQRMTTAAPSLEATSLRCLALLELLRGRPDKARTMLAEARQIVADLGLRHALMETELFAGIIELLAGDPVTAEPYFRTALDGLDALGMGVDAGLAAALLARSLLAQGRIADADRFAAESEHLAGHNLKTAIAWRAVRAEILAAQGSHGPAVDLAHEAVALAAETDLVLDHAEACLTLSRVLTMAGEPQRAEQARRRAESLYAAKEAIFLSHTDPNTGTPPVAAETLTTSRLATANRASRVLFLLVDAGSVNFATDCVYDDRRRIGGEPIIGNSAFVAAAERKNRQYPHIETLVRAVRGETLALFSTRWWDDAGNETMTFDLYEVGEEEAIRYWGRFDDDDLAGACAELERRYYAGEGMAFAANGLKVVAFTEALRRQDVLSARGLARPEFRWFAGPSALKPDERTLDGLLAWRAERLGQVRSFNDWLPAIVWLSPDCCLALCRLRGIGGDGGTYDWNRIYVAEYRNGLAASVREFDVDDEAAAFAYAERLVGPHTAQMPIENRAGVVAFALNRMMNARDLDGAFALFADRFDYDDHRRISAGPIADIRAGIAHLQSDYTNFETEALAVRGECLWMGRSRRHDAAGNSSASIDLIEVSDAGVIEFFGRFEEDDFRKAYTALERRYYAGEGLQFAVGGLSAASLIESLATGDLATARHSCAPGFLWHAPAAGLKPRQRSVGELFRWMQERGAQVSSQEYWTAVIRWLSPCCALSRNEIAARGGNGEEYRWTQICVSEIRDGLPASVHEFSSEPDALAFADSLVAAQRSRLPVLNRAALRYAEVIEAFRSHDIDVAVGVYSTDFVYEDHRHINGDPVVGHRQLRAGMQRILDQYTSSETRTLAVRGDRLQLLFSRWSDGSGNHTEQLHLVEIDDPGLIVYEGRFEAGDFVRAYDELERRYYAGEGAPFAPAGQRLAAMVSAGNRGDIEEAFTHMAPALRIESRSRSILPERTVAELKASVEQLREMTPSLRMWIPAVHWLSDSWVIARQMREGSGPDGETYSWARLCLGEIRDGLLTTFCEFDAEDEDAAFAEAESRMRLPSSRLVVANRATAVRYGVLTAIANRDFDSAIRPYSDDAVCEDRRGFSAEAVIGFTAMRTACERMRRHYSHFDAIALAVRGERCGLGRYCCRDDAGNESTGLLVFEIDAKDQIVYEARFDEEAFGSAYAELESRYYAGEGQGCTQSGLAGADVVALLNLGDFDTMFATRVTDDLRVTEHARSGFPDRSSTELRSSLEDLCSLLGSVRYWFSALCWLSPTLCVGRLEREARGHAGEDYAWTMLLVTEWRNGRVCGIHSFDADAEDAAFACAESLLPTIR